MTAQETRQQTLAGIIALGPVIPVATLRDATHAVPLARALVAGGIRVIEVALRTPAALEAIRVIGREVKEAVVGAGTVTSGASLDGARAAGACFAVSPGATPQLLAAAERAAIPLLPGVATASEAMALFERGYRHLKFYPAVPAGGAKVLAAWAEPLPALRFCPTGGIGMQNAAGFLALPNVPCVGGSWLTRADTLAAGDWARVEQLAREAASLRSCPPPVSG